MNNDLWRPYYTPLEVAQNILSHLPNKFKPNVVIDICAGMGNFLKSTSVLGCNEADYFGFDINLDSEIKKNTEWNITKLNSLRIDALISKVPNNGKRLVVANPPFGYFGNKMLLSKSKIELNDLILEANRLNRIEAKMLVSNLALMGNGDVFAALLPENLFVSEGFEKYRGLFLSRFKIIYMGKPQKYFKGCEVRTRQFIGIYREPLKSNLVDHKNAVIQQREIKIIRGIDNSKLQECKNVYQSKNKTEVLHFNNTEGILRNRRFIPNTISQNIKAIKSQDLLVIRVGRSTGTVLKAKPEYIGKLYSDYFFLVENLQLSTKKLIKFEKSLRATTKGLTTNYISRNSIMDALDKLVYSNI